MGTVALSPVSRADALVVGDPGVPLAKPRSTPGYTLPPASQVAWPGEMLAPAG